MEKGLKLGNVFKFSLCIIEKSLTNFRVSHIYVHRIMSLEAFLRVHPIEYQHFAHGQ